MASSVGKLSRGSLSYNKNYKPNGLKAYARAALKCPYTQLSCFCDEALVTDLTAQTTSVPRLMDRYVLSKKSNKLGNSGALVARPGFTVMCSP